jgi:hypothetical protein
VERHLDAVDLRRRSSGLPRKVLGREAQGASMPKGHRRCAAMRRGASPLLVALLFGIALGP